MLQSVRARTTLVASLVVAIALAFASAALLVLLRDRLVAVEFSATALRSRDVAALAADGEVPDNLSFPGDDDGFTQVVSSDGRVVAATGNVAGESPQSEMRPQVGERSNEIRSELPVGDGERFAISARAVQTDDGRVTVLTGASLHAADETLRSVANFLLIGTPVLIALVALVTRQVVNRALSPVDGIQRQVTEISQMDLHKRVPEPGTGDEIDRLAQSMNQMLDRLERSSERQSRFVADAAHELRSPLASARTTLEVSAAHPSGEAMLLAAINDALLDHDRLEALLDDLLMLARLDDPSATQTMRSIDLRDVVATFIESRTDDRLGVEMSQGPVLVTGSSSQLSRVLTNVVDNALSHCRSAVELSLLSANGNAVIIVDDNGPGVPVEDRDRIFERFVRLDQARTAERGTGLGLAIVRDTVLAHHGEVELGESPLGGARVTLRLPLESRPLLTRTKT
ncbi:MAG: HAMP domain-containing protein [Actinobacteria bacterium]|nr:HAMP domain-containing protein [Actinomycetota bacterium]MSY21405.1 HAMP domain-containing protein [Actinomycetota bacterium]